MRRIKEVPWWIAHSRGENVTDSGPVWGKVDRGDNDWGKRPTILNISSTRQRQLPKSGTVRVVIVVSNRPLYPLKLEEFFLSNECDV